ncbi:MAG: hypothetical protein AABY22_31125 [Nanoarchaeota archaeon]
MGWVKGSNGKRSASLTFALIGFLVVMIKYIIAGSSFTIAGHNADFSPFDAGSGGVILSATLGSYVFRRHTDAKNPSSDKSEEKQE